MSPFAKTGGHSAAASMPRRLGAVEPGHGTPAMSIFPICAVNTNQ
jgi:hypothetical protein